MRRTMRYRDFTYPLWLDSPPVRFVWRILFCRGGWHLWDEVESIEEHYLFCDACEETAGLG